MSKEKKPNYKKELSPKEIKQLQQKIFTIFKNALENQKSDTNFKVTKETSNETSQVTGLKNESEIIRVELPRKSSNDPIESVELTITKTHRHPDGFRTIPILKVTYTAIKKREVNDPTYLSEEEVTTISFQTDIAENKGFIEKTKNMIKPKITELKDANIVTVKTRKKSISLAKLLKDSQSVISEYGKPTTNKEYTEEEKLETNKILAIIHDFEDKLK